MAKGTTAPSTKSQLLIGHNLNQGADIVRPLKFNTMISFLFTTWLGGVICCVIALLFAGLPIVNWLNKKKEQAIAEAKHLREELHKHSSHTNTGR